MSAERDTGRHPLWIAITCDVPHGYEGHDATAREIVWHVTLAVQRFDPKAQVVSTAPAHSTLTEDTDE